MKKIIVYILFFLLLILLWQYFGSTNNRVKLLVSSPSNCINFFAENSTQLLQATYTTFYESVLGLLLAISIAFVLMIICFYFDDIYKFVLPLILGSQVIPLITLAPFLIIWLGIGVESKIALVAIISFYPIFLNFSTGYNSIPISIFELLDIYKARKSFRIFKIYFPLSLQNIFTGLKISATLSVIGAIVAEFTGAEIGIGKNLLLSSIRIEPELMMISIFLSALIGGILFGVIYLSERVIGNWYINGKEI